MKMAPCRHICSARGQSKGQVHHTWETWGREGKGDTWMWERLLKARPFSKSSGDKGVWGSYLSAEQITEEFLVEKWQNPTLVCGE